MKKIIRNKYFKISLAIIMIVGLSLMGFNLKSKKIVEGVAEFSIPQKYNQPLVVAVLNRSLSIKPVNANIAKANFKSENVIEYVDAYNNTDVVQTRETNKLKEDIILKKAGHPYQFEYALNLKDYDYEIDRDGNLNFYTKGHLKQADEELYKVFTIPKPFMYEQGKENEHGKVDMKIKGDKLVLTPDSYWIASHKYPIIVDPTIKINIINIFSSPRLTQDWQIYFTTSGSDDLKIIPDKKTAEQEEFIYLKCGDEILQPQILSDNSIYYPNWSCDKIAEIKYKTVIEDEHQVKFKFGSLELVSVYNTLAGSNCYELLINVDPTDASEENGNLGDIVVIKECGWKWGIGEQDKSKFRIIKVPFLTEKQISKFLQPEYINEETGEISKYRKYKIDYNVYNKNEYAVTSIIKLKEKEEKSVIKK